MAWADPIARAALVGFVLLATAGGLCAAPAADPKFAIMSGGSLPKVGLNDELKIRIIDGASTQPKKLQLRLDGWLLDVEPRVLPSKAEPIFIFRLLRTDANRAMWAQLLGSPLNRSRAKNLIPVGVELDGKALDARSPPQPDEAPEPKIDLIPYNDGLMIVGFIVTILAVVTMVVWCITTPMIRDSLIPQIRLSERPYSLGRTQMAFWSCLVFTSFLFILIVTLDINSITAETFTLIGISASTALGAVAIDQSRNEGVLRTQRALEAMGIKTSADVDTLYAQANINNGAGRAPDILAGATIPARPGSITIIDPTVRQLLNEYEFQVKQYVSDGFLKDIVNDINGPTVHRWQILIWTIVLGAIYIIRVYSNLETPTFGTNLLALMGISGGIYLGFKIPEKQTSAPGGGGP